MKVLIGQPFHENGVKQISDEIRLNREIDIVLYPEGYLSSKESLKHVCNLAREYNVMIITSYRLDNIDNNGEEIFIAKSDTGTRIVDIDIKEVECVF